VRLLPSLFLPEDEALNMEAIGRGERRKTEVEEPWNWPDQEVVNANVGEHQGNTPR